MNKERLIHLQEIEQNAHTEVSNTRIEADEMAQEVQNLQQELREAQMAADQRDQKEREANNIEHQIQREIE